MAEMWPTPDVRGFTNEGALKMLVEVAEDREEFSGMAYRAGMKNKEALWPTPMASDADKNSKNRDRYLPGAVQKYPTPTANDAKNTLTESQRGRGTLTGHLVESLWPTPRTAGMCGGTGAWAKLKEKAAGIEEARQMGAGNGGRLSPDWVERLMGYPDGWTDIEQENVNMKNCYPAAWFDGSWDTIPRVVSGVKNRTGRLICLGNAVVPQIPMLIWQMIKEFL
jgi:hypothetical protein